MTKKEIVKALEDILNYKLDLEYEELQGEGKYPFLYGYTYVAIKHLIDAIQGR